MSEPAKLYAIWLNEGFAGKEIRIDWTNERHHAVVIEKPYDKNAVMDALKRALNIIGGDKVV